MLAEEIKKDRTMGISEKEAYKILQLKRGASEEETKKQYRRYRNIMFMIECTPRLTSAAY